MSRFAHCVSVAATSVTVCTSLSAPSQAAVVVEYNAATAVSVPSAPDWDLVNGVPMTLSGGVLHQNAAAGDASAYRAKATAGLMTRNTSDYSLEFKTQVLLDTPGSDWYTNNFLVWGDNTQSYSLTLFKNGATGGLKAGNGTTISNLTDVVTGLNWATAHDVYVSYTGASDQFAIYVDGALATTVAPAAIYQGGVEPFWQNRVVFGDYISGASANGPTQTDWSAIRLYNTAVNPTPEPAALSLIGFGAIALRRRRA